MWGSTLTVVWGIEVFRLYGSAQDGGMEVGACGRCMECARRAQLDEWMSALQEMANAYGLREVSWTEMVVRHLLLVLWKSFDNRGLTLVCAWHVCECDCNWSIWCVCMELRLTRFCGLIAPGICMDDMSTRKEFFRAAAIFTETSTLDLST